MVRSGKETGFSLIELLVVMAIFGFVIAGASQMFVGIITDFKQQGRLAVTNIESVLGLEVMRKDLQNAGYGLFSDPGDAVLAYTEVPSGTDAAGFALNDAPPLAPRALVVGAGSGVLGSDRLAIKATSVGLSERGDVWTYNKLSADKTNSTNYAWQLSADQPKGTDRVIMLSLDLSQNKKKLVPAIGGGFFTQYSNATSITAGFSLARKDVSAIYFVDDKNNPKMPFNRTDYYIQVPANQPMHCATGTATLYKAVVRNSAGSNDYETLLPILDCVADMQVALVLAQATGTGLTVTETTAALKAEDIRRVREARVYILAQEGQRDKSFTYPNSQVWVGEKSAPYPVGTVGRSFDLSANITDWQRYRWKLYTLVVRPANIKI